MDRMLKRFHILILIAVLIGTVAFVSRPSYAGGAVSEVPGVIRTQGFSVKSRAAKVTIKWSKAYSRMADGTVGDVTGYQIEYSTSSDFSEARKVNRGQSKRKATITLKELNTIKKYNNNISKYHFRIRSYVKVDGVRVYSKWAEATSANKVKVYSPVTLKSITADRNSVTAEWEKQPGAKGYIVYSKKAGARIWKKKTTIRDPEKLSFQDDGLAYSCEYVYSVISYRTQTSTDPSALNTSCLKILSDGENVYRVSTASFSIETPKLRALFDDDVLDITWYTSPGAEDYYIQLSKDKDFPAEDTKELPYKKDDLVDGMDSYTIELEDGDVDLDDYYVRVRAAAQYKNKSYSSEWSDVKHAEYGAGTYKIIYDGNGATAGEMKPSAVSCGEEFDLSDNRFSRDGYTFTGWCLEKKNQVYLDAELPIQIGMPEYADSGLVRNLAEENGTVTLYACWQGSGPEAAADWASIIASDDEFVYGPKVKNHCWFCQGGNKYYICNALVAAAYTHGMPYFSGYKSGSTDWSWWVKNGFTDIGQNAPIQSIRKGDVICCWNGKRWGHIMIAVTDGNIKKPQIAHAAGRGLTEKSIRVDKMADRLAKYSKYHVVRYEG